MTFPRCGALCVGVLFTMMACSRDAQKNDTLAQDSTLAHDLQLANADSTAQPQLKDVPATPPPAAPQRAAPEPAAPRRTPPRPTPPRVIPNPPPQPAPRTTTSGNTVESRSPSGNTESARVGTIAAGTTLALSAGQRICTNTNTPGDRFTATLMEPVQGSNGVVLPAGSTAVLEVTSLKQSTNSGDKMNIELAVRSISYGGKTYPITGDIVSADLEKVRSKDNNDAGKVIGGAAVGAILGRVLGGKNKTKGTVVGAAGGAAAGAVLAQATAKYDACLPTGSKILVRLNSAIQVQAVTSSSGNVAPTSSGI